MFSLKTSAYLESCTELMLKAFAVGDNFHAQLLAESVVSEARALNPKFYTPAVRWVLLKDWISDLTTHWKLSIFG